ncbi:hypothetical protein D7V97_35660 [Corallococcus sp. CA053C]|uniref:hypothetical protein n=1 Tax=Corallococcus sp. CA053C TaxID=2316732 RepID=UPI000EA0200A|nr:hypothetical protein [Corallococcus sp. CA053C]RKG96382.1 hypothetical protein D7V97_35660 [Corallococcus sp. CA053C]
MKLGTVGLVGLLGLAAGCATDAAKPTALERRDAVRSASDKTYRSMEGFQEARWGMTPEEVRAALPDASVGPDGTLRMKTTIADVPAEVSLGFLENRLAAVDVFFPEVSDPRTLQALMRDLLTRKFGDPRRPKEVARQVKRGELPVRFAADLPPVQEVEGAATSQTLEGALGARGGFALINRWLTLESQVNLTQWALPESSVLSIQYESAKYAPKRADLIGRYSHKARQDLVKEL